MVRLRVLKPTIQKTHYLFNIMLFQSLVYFRLNPNFSKSQFACHRTAKGFLPQYCTFNFATIFLKDNYFFFSALHACVTYSLSTSQSSMKETGRTLFYYNDQLGETDYGQRSGKVNPLGVLFYPRLSKGKERKNA